jgi:hypothetical protein
MMANKYNAIKTTINGVQLDSRLEAMHYQYLLIKQQVGRIGMIEVHPEWQIILCGKKICKVVLDFKFTDCETGKTRYVDSKGVDTAISRLKRKLLQAQECIKVEVWTKKKWGFE